MDELNWCCLISGQINLTVRQNGFRKQPLLDQLMTVQMFESSPSQIPPKKTHARYVQEQSDRYMVSNALPLATILGQAQIRNVKIIKIPFKQLFYLIISKYQI